MYLPAANKPMAPQTPTIGLLTSPLAMPMPTPIHSLLAEFLAAPSCRRCQVGE